MEGMLIFVSFKMQQQIIDSEPIGWSFLRELDRFPHRELQNTYPGFGRPDSEAIGSDIAAAGFRIQ
jgi:hypothetical protein